MSVCFPGGPRVWRVNPKGEKTADILLEEVKNRPHGQTRKILRSGDIYLYTPMFGSKLCEVNPNGKLLKTTKLERIYGFDIARLSNGHTLLACGSARKVVELDVTGKNIWYLERNDLEMVKLLFVCSVQRLHNGNTIFANWDHHIKEELPPQPMVVEVTGDKNVAWTFGPSADILCVMWVRVCR